jgi:integrase
MAIAAALHAFLSHPRRPHRCVPVTLDSYRYRWARFAAFCHAAGLRDMEQVNAEHAAAFARTLEHLSPNRYNKILDTCRLVFRTLARECADMPNPFADLPRRTLATRHRQELTIDQLRAVLESAAGELRILLAIGLYAGLRLHDAALLQWPDVDLRRNMLYLEPFKTRRTGKRLTIPIALTLRAMLTIIPADARAGDVLPGMAAMYRHRPQDVGLIVTDHFRRCGLTVHADGTGPGTGKRAVVVLSFHSLRHSFVSLSAAAGVPLPVVQELAGHGSPAIQRHYVHVGESAARAGIAALPDVLSGEGSERQALQAEIASLAAGAGADRLRAAIALLNQP